MEDQDMDWKDKSKFLKECIIVDKVYDSCYDTITVTETFTPHDGMCSAVTGCSVDLANVVCNVGTVTASDTANYSIITFVISAPFTVTCDSHSFTHTAETTDTVELYNPAGTTPSCAVVSAACACAVLPSGRVSCTITLCVIKQTTATVQLMIPAYGFCELRECGQVGPVPPCPPGFPPQLMG